MVPQPSFFTASRQERASRRRRRRRFLTCKDGNVVALERVLDHPRAQLLKEFALRIWQARILAQVKGKVALLAARWRHQAHRPRVHDARAHVARGDLGAHQRAHSNGDLDVLGRRICRKRGARRSHFGFLRSNVCVSTSID